MSAGCSCDVHDGSEHWSSCAIYVQPDPPARLFVNDSGEVACAAHGGYYLAREVATYPERTTHTTPLDAWRTATDVEVATFAAVGLECAGCTR